MKPANSVLIRSSDTESAGPTAPQCRESLFYLFCLSTLTGADQTLVAIFFFEYLLIRSEVYSSRMGTKSRTYEWTVS